MSVESFKTFLPPGPVAESFLADSWSKVRLLRGPVGGGKTVTCIFDGLNRAARLLPVCRDGWIHYRRAVIGSTYGQLERNLYPSWQHWLPKDGGWTEGEWDGGGGRFARQTLRFKVERNGRAVPVKYETIFAAIGELSVEVFVRGFEPSDWYLFECDQLPEGIIEQAVGRLGRYPNGDMLPADAAWSGGVIGDLNAPDIDSWYYRYVEELRPEGVRQYLQPSGLSAHAENLQNIKVQNYYEHLAEMNKHRPRWVRRFVKNQYGPSDDGEPVFGDLFSDDVHLSREPLSPLPGLPLLLGFDQGLRAACIVAQRTPKGQLRVLAECRPGRMGPHRFAEQVRRTIADVAPGVRVAGAWADPAGFTGADKEGGELAWAEIVSSVLDVPIAPAPTNELNVRLAAVEDELRESVGPGEPALLISASCRQLRKGFVSEYRFEKRSPGQRQVLVPVKDAGGYADLHDALQYLLLGERGRYGVIAGKRPGSCGQSRGRGRCTIVKSSVALP